MSVRPRRVVNFGGRRRFGMLKGPIPLGFCQVDFVLGVGRFADAGVGGAHLDPFLEVCDHVLGKLPLGRHFEPLVLDRLDQQALVGMLRRDHLARVASFTQAVMRVKNEMPFGLGDVPRVALVAVVHQDRPDFLFEEIDAFLRGARFGRAGGRTPRSDLGLRSSCHSETGHHDDREQHGQRSSCPHHGLNPRYQKRRPARTCL